jgi:hypothetical protein
MQLFPVCLIDREEARKQDEEAQQKVETENDSMTVDGVDGTHF